MVEGDVVENIERWRGSVDAKLGQIEMALLRLSNHMESMMEEMTTEKRRAHESLDARIRKLEETSSRFAVVVVILGAVGSALGMLVVNHLTRG